MKYAPPSLSYTKCARNSGRDAPPGFIDDVLDVGDRSVMPMVVEKEHLVEPYAGEDKGTCAGQAFGRAGFEIIGLDEALEEQLDGFAAIGVEVAFPRVWVSRQLLGSEQPAAVLRIGRPEGGPAKRRVAQQ